MDWTEEHPYGALRLPSLKAHPGDRDANLKRAIAARRTQVREAAAHIEDPASRDEIRRQRQENGADGRYCWK